MLVCILAILLTLLFPPYSWHFNHNNAGVGFGFIFTGPFNTNLINRARIDITVLLTLWGGILLISALASQINFGFIEIIQKRVDQFIADVKTKSTRIIVVFCLILFFGASGYYLNQMIVNGCFSENPTPKFKFNPADKRVETDKKPLDFSAYGTPVKPVSEEKKYGSTPLFGTPETRVKPDERPLDFSAFSTSVE
tara:strand:- start:1673 stop:2257 length:585 start_codon:yes stop_codon:yes gene_type:complete